MELHDGETVVETYPIWTPDHEAYINSCRTLGYPEATLSLFRMEIEAGNIDRIEDFHNYLKNRNES